MIFIDTSAFMAIILRNDVNHGKARAIWDALLDSEEALISSNYVLIETISLIQSRIGMEAVRVFFDDLVPVLHMEWVDAIHHRIAMESLIAANRRNLSLVDCTSFAVMRKKGINRAFAFDRHFPEYGFQCIEP
ncbi:MAG: type II toxin-antitoxin system VapC family toxin [Candidatus Xenobiia bacterium LiM19]